MDMKNQESRQFRVDLRHVDGLQFQSQASEEGRDHGAPYLSDEPDPVGAAGAPASPALLGSAIGHCLSASLLETLRHAHIPVDDLSTEVTAVVMPNSANRPRIHHVDVTLRPILPAPSSVAARCEEVFQKNCTITSSVREGIEVRVHVEWAYSDADKRDDDNVRLGGEKVPG
jgi:organic hydroperoxide reductase OsmC/OhrA